MSDVKEDIRQMLDQLAGKDELGAAQSLHSILADKVNSAIENMKVDVADTMFNGGVKEEFELDEAVSRKDFKLAADTIKNIEDPAKRQEIANSHAAVYAKANPRFNHSMFHAACGTKCNEEVELDEAYTRHTVDSCTTKGSDKFEMHTHSKGQPHEWSSIIKTHQGGKSLKNDSGGFPSYKTGKTSYIKSHFDKMKRGD